MAPRMLACAACHGKEGRSTPEGYFPRIAGKPVGYLYNQLQNFRDGRRNYAPMAHLLRHMTDAYLWEIASYFAAQDLPYPPAAAAKVPASTLDRGAQLALHGDAARGIPACAQCHGPALAGGGSYVPGLLGLPRDYINGQIGAWKAGQRRAHAPDCMARVANALTPEDIGAVSAWLSAQAVPPPSSTSSVSLPLPWPCGGIGAAAPMKEAP
ncbi:c-type cytochrome [Acidovorax sp. Leaf160]|uniref:c-type cytochrome n=1 Tax=Acidovorax sp. Leaf160 TaxID=1736280 RepID=UPI0006FB3F87|nr:c-type cytochrome [Acidovorax sp. Leaf160]KQR45976.1 cytochrome C [Acidovorax sp. Leaf160]